MSFLLEYFGMDILLLCNELLIVSIQAKLGAALQVLQLQDIHTTFPLGNDTFCPVLQIAPVGISYPTFSSRLDLQYLPTL